MLSYEKERHRIKSKSPVLKNTELNLFHEYSLKRSQFNPKKNSPNIFCNKLEFRMKQYYNTLYTLSSSPPK